MFDKKTNITRKKEIIDFWNENPLGSFEIKAKLGSKEFFVGFEQIKAESSNMARHLFKFEQLSDRKVLDIGCGPGWIAVQYAKARANVTAIDITSNAAKIAKEYFKLENLKGNVLVADAEKLPFLDSAFDFVSSDGVLHHTPETEYAIREVFRVLKPEGKALISLYYRNWYLRPWIFPITKLIMHILNINTPHGINSNKIKEMNCKELARIYDGKDNPLGKIYSRNECNQMFERVGFRILKGEVHFFPIRFIKLLRNSPVWIRRFCDRTCGTMIFYLLKKETNTAR